MEYTIHPPDIQTKLDIVSALTNLLENTPFEQVTINEICKMAHISRSTFYRHFESRDAIPLWHIEHLFRIGSFEIGRTRTWYEGHLITLAAMNRWALLYQRLELPNGCAPLRKYSTKSHVDNLKETLTKYHRVALTKRLEFQVETFAKTRTDITKKWVFRGFDPEPRIFAEYTNSVVPAELFSLLDISTLKQK